jgi:hypothetical protein
VLGTVHASDHTRLVGWDRDRLFFQREGVEETLSASDNGFALSDVSSAALTGSTGTGPLADVAADVELREKLGVMTVMRPSVEAAPVVPGTSGQLSPDGRFVLTVGGPDGTAAYDSATGEPEGTWFLDDWTPMAAAFTSSGRVVWSVSRVGSYSLIDCLVSRGYMNSFDVDSEPCRSRVDLHGVPLLAGRDPGLVPST